MLRMNDSYSWAWGTYAKTMKFHGHKNKTSVQEFKGKKVLTFANHNVPLPSHGRL